VCDVVLKIAKKFDTDTAFWFTIASVGGKCLPEPRPWTFHNLEVRYYSGLNMGCESLDVLFGKSKPVSRAPHCPNPDGQVVYWYQGQLRLDGAMVMALCKPEL
jgi:hypothetical protein